MGKIIKPGEIKQQTSSIIQALQADNAALETTLPNITNFESEPDLDGLSWKGLKSQIGAHRSVLQGLIVANEQLIHDSETLTNSVGDEDLDEDKINEQIEKLENQNTSYKTFITNYSDSKRRILSSSPGSGNANLSLLSYYTTQINSLNNLVSLNNQAIKELQDKLQKIIEIESATQNLYKGSESLYSSVNQGISAIQGNWNSSGFNVLPSSNNWQSELDNSWNVRTQQKYMEALKKIPNLTMEDMALITQYASDHPDEEAPQSLLDFLKENWQNILGDTAKDTFANLIEQAGVQLTTLGGLLNVLTSIKGPAGPNSFIIVNPNGFGSRILGAGNKLTKFGKGLGIGFAVAGFGLGMYDDIANEGKTVGQAISHNAVSTGLGLGAGALGVAGVGLLMTNPGGWAILGGIAVGTVVSTAFDYAYKNNFLGLQDGLDWVGDRIDDGINWAGDKINEGLDYAKDKLNDVGEAISGFGEAINPMNWAW